MISVAIDGPAGAGKSTVAKALAKKIGYVYVDTGALYRTVALSIINTKTNADDVSAVEELLKNITVDIKYVNGEQRVLLCGEDVSDKIRTPEISMMASKSSAIPCVRAFLLETQRSIARNNNVIMDGRDIATVVLPNAQVKIFLTADPEERAKRRYIELTEKGEKVNFDDVLKDIIERDYNDSHREIAPLKPSEESVVFNNTGYSIDESIAGLEKIIFEKANV